MAMKDSSLLKFALVVAACCHSFAFCPTLVSARGKRATALQTLCTHSHTHAETSTHRGQGEPSRRQVLQKSLSALPVAAVLGLGPRSAHSADDTYKSGVTSYDVSKLADEWEGFLPERVVTRGGSRIVVAQEFGDKKKNGLAVYEGNLILTAYMESLGKDFWQGTRVLELGCGTGLGSITASVMGASSVTASDREPAVLALALKNMKSNIKNANAFRTARVSWGTDVCSSNTEAYKRQIAACWDPSARAPKGLQPQPLAKDAPGLASAPAPGRITPRALPTSDGAYDVIIGADLTYTSGLIEPLAKTLKDFSGPNTEIILCWCEPKLFTFNTDVMAQLNADGIPVFERDFNVERITSGPAFDAGLSNKSRSFILRLTRK